MNRILSSLLLTFCFCCTIFAQADAQDAKTKKLLEQAAKSAGARPVQSEITVNGNVHVEAVLIPREDAWRIFGKEIASHYAVIEVNIGNKSPDAALVIHGIFIDYRDWPLSGSGPSLNMPGRTDKYQAASIPSQVSSEEYRVIRGQILDAQSDTVRNRFIRWLTLAGNLAGAFTFSLNEQGIVKGIAAATGVGIPGVATAWPDRTIEQINRVSDLGFRSNKLIPKQGSDVVVCFFPIDRFLTPGFKKIFLKSPAIFFAPGQMLVDRAAKKEVDDAIGDLLQGFQFDDGKTYSKETAAGMLRQKLPCFITITHPIPGDPAYDFCLGEFGLQRAKDTKAGEARFELRQIGTEDEKKADRANFQKFRALEFINSVSLNRVTVTVDGVMTVDVKSIAGRIDEIDMDKVAECGDDAECFWTNVKAGGGVRTGVIRGAYLKGGKVALAEQEALGITELKTIEDGSSDDELHFSFKLGKRMPNNQTKLHFTVIKDETVPEGAPAKKLESNTWEYLAAFSQSPISIIDRTLSGTPPSGTTFLGTTLTVTGKGFSATDLVVTFHSEVGTDITVKPNATPTLTDTKFDVALPTSDNNFTTGCWRVQVTAGGLTSNSSEWFSPKAPEPTLDSATRTDKAIYLKGKDLINLSKCDGNKISFRLNQTGAASIPLTVSDWNNGDPELVLPEAAKTGTWRVEVLFDGKALSTVVDKELKAQSP